MNQNKFTFESQKLVVHYITFKFQDLDNLHQTRIAKHLFQLGFNSYKASGKSDIPMKEPILVNFNNKFEVLFVKKRTYWEGTSLLFPGLNATRFYFFAKKQIIDWTIFSSAVLSRFDLYFERNHKTSDKISDIEFLENLQRELSRRHRNVSLEKNSKGFILKIGNRRSNNYFRIYQRKKKNSLKFEHEMTGTTRFLQKCQTLLVHNRLEEFEQKLSSHFLLSFGKLLPIHYSYLDWLVIQLRPIRKQTTLQYGLNSDYIQSEILVDTKTFVSLIQFLNYAQDLDFEIQYLDSIAYRKVAFKLRDFLEFQDPSVKPTNHYRLAKIKEFFQKLQTGLYVTSFSNKYFQSLVIVPQVKFEKSPQQKFLIAKVCLVEELFNYKYPFYLPNFFQNKISKHEFYVRFKVMQVFTSVNIMKEFFIQEFLDSYPYVLSNQQKTRMKRYFIQLVKLLEDHDLIEPKYKIIHNGALYNTQELTTKNISQGFVVYEKLSI